MTAAWTDHGTATDRRQLKHRARDAVRVIPIPPVLVAILRDHIERFATAADGRLFEVTWGPRGKGGILSVNVYGRIWQKARAAAPHQGPADIPTRRAPLRPAARRRHPRVPAPEVASRAGHSTEVLWRIYAGCIDGHQPLWNQRIEEALSDGEQPPEHHPGTHRP